MFGYFALKRTSAGLVRPRVSPVSDAIGEGEPTQGITVGSRES
jgi:hypothetical protein